jgi:uroporphyrinogen-III decarboxylase
MLYAQTTDELLDRVARIEGSEKNRRRKAIWESSPIGGFSVFKAAPRNLTFEPGKNRGIPLTVDFDFPLWADILDFDIHEYFHDPEAYLRANLAMKIFRHDNLDDDTYVDRSVDIWLGITMENSLFGVKSIFPQDDNPWSDPRPVIQELSDIEAIELPDFYTSGLMPRVLHFYEKIKELCGEEFDITFDWRQGPFGIARFLRGYENILIDTLENPDFVHRLMRLIVDSCRKWHEEKSKYLDKPIERNILGNDDISSPSVSPVAYDQYILPYEQELSEFYGGLLYWHSCGDVTPLMPYIRKIDDIEVFHVGPWTDLRQAVELFCPRSALEICLNPVEIMDGDQASMRRRLEEIVMVCGDNPVTIRNDCMSRGKSAPHAMEKMKTWIETAREVLSFR